MSRRGIDLEGAVSPGAVVRPRHLEHPTHPLDAIDLGALGDKPKVGHRMVPLARVAAALRWISRSTLSSEFSFLSARGSLRSSSVSAPSAASRSWRCRAARIELHPFLWTLAHYRKRVQRSPSQVTPANHVAEWMIEPNGLFGVSTESVLQLDGSMDLGRSNQNASRSSSPLLGADLVALGHPSLQSPTSELFRH